MNKLNVKAWIVRILGPALVDAAKHVLGRSHFDEVNLVYEAFGQIQRTGTMVDVGAHHGGSLGRFAADGWRVLAFEPDDGNRAFLKIAHGHRANLTIDTHAVADQPETGKAYFASNVSSGISGLSAFHESHEQRQSVDVTTLAESLPAYGIAEVDFLKIDTEGHDLFVLKGVDWEAASPSVIVCEFEDRKTVPLGYGTDELVAYLEGRGYEVAISEWWPIVEYGLAHKWRRFTPDDASLGEKAWGNLIAYRRDTEFAEALGRVISNRK